ARSTIRRAVGRPRTAVRRQTRRPGGGVADAHSPATIRPRHCRLFPVPEPRRGIDVLRNPGCVLGALGRGYATRPTARRVSAGTIVVHRPPLVRVNTGGRPRIGRGGSGLPSRASADPRPVVQPFPNRPGRRAPEHGRRPGFGGGLLLLVP